MKELQNKLSIAIEQRRETVRLHAELARILKVLSGRLRKEFGWNVKLDPFLGDDDKERRAWFCVWGSNLFGLRYFHVGVVDMDYVDRSTDEEALVSVVFQLNKCQDCGHALRKLGCKPTMV